MKCNRYDTEISVKEFCLPHYSLGSSTCGLAISFGCWITWSISSWQEHYKSAFLFTKAEWWVNNISRWLFYYTKLLVKRGKNSGQMGVKPCVTEMVRMSSRKPALWKCIISGVRYRSKFWYLRRKPADMFSKWVFFQNSLLLSWPI